MKFIRMFFSKYIDPCVLFFFWKAKVRLSEALSIRYRLASLVGAHISAATRAPQTSPFYFCFLSQATSLRSFFRVVLELCFECTAPHIYEKFHTEYQLCSYATLMYSLMAISNEIRRADLASARYRLSIK